MGYDEMALAIEKYLKEHPKEDIELRSFIQDELKESDWRAPAKIASILRKKAKYNVHEYSRVGNVHPFFLVSRKKNLLQQLGHDIILALIAALLSLIVGWLLLQPDKKQSALKNRQQDETLTHHSDSLKNLTNALTDSLKAIRNDMNK